jgi:diadenosine tetraphosphate (Ap4A) HIT family hydrolase
VNDPGCVVCGMIDAATADEIFLETDEWLAHTMVDAPGWAILSLKRHAEGIWSMTEDEAATLGPILGALGKGLHDEAGGEKVHLFAMGERVPHLHMVLVPRKPGELPIFDGADLDARARQIADRAQALTLAGAVRATMTVLERE